ncbi:MAG: dependent oxidoreductase [Verrucomicrobia bacterium]|nr:dependent oxidoreductase [Verrucomicrobiota bacterium]
MYDAVMRFLLGLFLALTLSAHAAENVSVLVYGSTPAGIAAAIAAAKDGETVLLVEPTPQIGGMLTHGLSHTDYHVYEGITGTYLDFCKRVEAYYRKTYGENSQQVKDSFRGAHGEPKVNLMIIEQMVSEQARITVKKEWVLTSVKMAGNPGERTIQMATFKDARGKQHEYQAKVFIDATYEGDLMAAAKVKYHVGREGKDVYGEELAPEKGDGQLQGYNFRFCMTQSPTNRVLPKMPKGYTRERFAGVLELFATGKLKKVFGYNEANIYKAHIPPLPNGKHDINDQSRGLVRLSLPGDQAGWPEGDTKLWNLGLLYFFQNDPAVPKHLREEALSWGLCKDEFVETGNIPGQIYVREARRMVGVHVYTQNDTQHAPGDARGILHTNAIALGEYTHNCHGTLHEGSHFGGKHTGEFYQATPPYQIPYGVLLPKDVKNLLVPGAMSSSHVGFCALRLEPIWTSLGQASGHAAAMAVKAKSDVQSVNVAKLQRRLHEVGSGTIYTTDVPPGHLDFAMVQWWGTAGGLHGLAPMPDKPGARGKKIISQYHENYPGHDVEPGKVLDAELAARWIKLATSLGIKVDAIKADGKVTRGEWLRMAYKNAAKP